MGADPSKLLLQLACISWTQDSFSLPSIMEDPESSIALERPMRSPLAVFFWKLRRTKKRDKVWLFLKGMMLSFNKKRKLDNKISRPQGAGVT